MCTGRWRYPAILAGLFNTPSAFAGLRAVRTLLLRTGTSPASALSRAQGRRAGAEAGLCQGAPSKSPEAQYCAVFQDVWMRTGPFWTGGYPSAKRPVLAGPSRPAGVGD